MLLELSAEQRSEKERIKDRFEEENRRHMREELKDSMRQAYIQKDIKLEEERQYEDFYTQRVCLTLLTIYVFIIFKSKFFNNACEPLY